MHACFCGYWEYAHRKGRWLWQRDAGERFGYIFAEEGSCCADCGYDLTFSPAETLQNLKAEDWNDSLVKGSCFYAEGAMRAIMPADVTGVVLVECNLDNCIIPEGATVEGGTNKNVWKQNDGHDWACDEADNPIEPLNRKAMVMEGLNVDPALIPARPLTAEAVKAAEQARDDARRLAEAEATVAELSARVATPTEDEPIGRVREVKR